MRRWFALFFILLIPAVASMAFQTTPPGPRKSNQTGAPTVTAPAAANPSGVPTHTDQVGATTDGSSTAPLRKYCGVLRGYSADKSALQLADRTDSARTAAGQQPCEHGDAVEIQVQGQALKDGLTNWKADDKIIATVAVSKTGATELATLRDIQSQVLQVEPWQPAVALFSFPLLVLLLTIFLKSVRELLFIGQDGRWSNSKTQISLWFTLWVSAYAAVFVLRWASPQHFLGSISTPSALLALSGISGLTFAGAKGITANKAANPTSAPVPTGVTPPNGKRNAIKAPRASLTDLLKDDLGNYDFGDFQMLVMTLIAVVSYTLIAYHFLGVLEARAAVSLPDVDGTVLAMFGVGQGAYLAKKASTGIDQ